MASLYKRYIPPKPATDQSTPVSRSLSTSLPAPIEAAETAEVPEKKRKRARTQEETVERKAKKLRKKGLNPEVTTASLVVDVPSNGATQDVSAEDGEEKLQSQGEFAHVKSIKKRHKLEKEARKARKAAEKESKLDAIDNTPEAAKVHDTQKVSESRPEVTDVHMSEENSTAGSGLSNIQPRKRRHKLERVLAGEIESAEDDGIASGDEDTERLKKFSGILGKFQKSTTLSQKLDSGVKESQAKEPVDESKIVRGLVLPLPEKAATPEFRPDDSSLPSWLAKPTTITSDSKRSFAELGMRAETVDFLSKLGFVDALPVQQAVLPVLLPPGIPGSKYLPGCEEVVPDLAVGAATGSGKTIAYLLPILEGLKRYPDPGRMRALIIVPTKELVQQVAAVAESLSKGSGIKIGMSTGTGRFRDEQQRLIRRSEQYNPEEYARLMSRAARHIRPIDENSDEYSTYIEELVTQDAKTGQRIQDAVEGLVKHIPVYESAVDILVATPGRLLEHLNGTLGFNLVYLQWLVIDEVDKLLDNQFEGFLETVNAEIARDRAIEEQDGREKQMRTAGLWNERRERRVRKAMFSATMTRDISKLMSLRLRRPQMIVVRGLNMGSEPSAMEVTVNDDGASGIRESDGVYELPSTLLEYCVPVGDGSEKPLIALELLDSRILTGMGVPQSRSDSPADGTDDSSGEDSDSSIDPSESDYTSSVSSDDGTSGDMSDSSDDSMAEVPAKAEPSTSPPPATFMHPDRLAVLEPAKVATVLIFTSSNEAASRLSHLLKSLRPAWASWITTLTKINANKGMRLQSKAKDPAVVISTDRAARGLDNFRGRPITHVIQYDVPRSMTSYIHRVGRTARAGRKGDAWTLFTRPEGRWFDNEILKSASIKRTSVVERVKLFVNDEALREQFSEVVTGMREEVQGS